MFTFSRKIVFLCPIVLKLFLLLALLLKYKNKSDTFMCIFRNQHMVKPDQLSFFLPTRKAKFMIKKIMDNMD
jgi:hypothetical protein